jgi:hypothetical protein
MSSIHTIQTGSRNHPGPCAVRISLIPSWDEPKRS